MSMSMTSTAAAVAVALLVVAGGAGLAAAGTSDLCGLAETAFGECTAYVAGGEPAVSRRCCRALGDIRDLAATAAERRAVCACILSEMLAAGDGRVDSGRAAGLPAACNVRVGFIPTSPNFNCFRVR
uniref:Non-specific lipid-transfer protein n=1 Tax=Oryza longistaminata TaxID=4528 RepID=A0A1V1H5L6_ORYLO|nr:lipid transfer-like protein [Oryza longistaminata]